MGPCKMIFKEFFNSFICGLVLYTIIVDILFLGVNRVTVILGVLCGIMLVISIKDIEW